MMSMRKMFGPEEAGHGKYLNSICWGNNDLLIIKSSTEIYF